MLVKSPREYGSTRHSQLPGSGFAGICLLLFSLATIMADVAVFIGAVKTGLAQWYPSVPGEITQSEVRERGGGKNHTVREDVRYRYTVDGEERTGDRVHFHGVGAGGRSAAQKIVEAYPAGRKVQVIYNSADPGDAALDRSIDGRLLFAALCLTPFNLVTIGGMWWVWTRMSGRRSVPLRRDGARWYVLPTNGQPFMVALMVLGVISTFTIFVILIFSGWGESLGAMLATWTVLLGLSGLAYWHTRSLVRREPAVLILDDDSATVTWPQSADVPEFSILRSQLLSVEMDDVPPSENPTTSNLDFSILLQFIGDDGQPAKRFVLKTHSGIEAASVADWLEDWAELPRPDLFARPRIPL